jgi:hypothetical protein
LVFGEKQAALFDPKFMTTTITQWPELNHCPKKSKKFKSLNTWKQNIFIDFLDLLFLIEFFGLFVAIFVVDLKA